MPTVGSVSTARKNHGAASMVFLADLHIPVWSLLVRSSPPESVPSGTGGLSSLAPAQGSPLHLCSQPLQVTSNQRPALDSWGPVWNFYVP